MKTFALFFSIFVSLAYSQNPFPVLTGIIKPSIVGIETEASSGSGVIVLYQNKTYVLTNEHVVSIKDSSDKTIANAKDTRISLNVRRAGAKSFSARIVKVDEESDLALLEILAPANFRDTIEGIAIPQSLWEKEISLKEGESVLYGGFPHGWGRGKINAPLIRTGIISQLPPESSVFLIDAFVQPGYSGSPVFLVRDIPGIVPAQWEFKFIGLCQAYPYSGNQLYRKTGVQAIPGFFVRENPGFTQVIGISAIEKFLTR